MNLTALFLVALVAVGYETALIRYFAVSKWSEYGYWVISIVMFGFALSGVVLALFRDASARKSDVWLSILPSALVITGAVGFYLTCINPFNPLQLQNPATWGGQILYVGLYYIALLPFFFLTGFFISLCFILQPRRIGLVYGFDLAGAALGAALVLAAMHVVHPFVLVPLLLPFLALAGWFVSTPARWTTRLTSIAVLIVAEAALIGGGRPEISDFKAIYAPLHTPDARAVTEIHSPRGVYTLVESFAERVDTDISNNAGMMGIPGPPRTYGLYRDGNRIAALPMAGGASAPYVQATLAAAPYLMIPGARTLLIGASGGFRIAEAKTLGASQIRVLEPEPMLMHALTSGLGPSPAYEVSPVIRVSGSSPLLAGVRGVYDVVDVAADFIDAAEANVVGLTVEAIAGYLSVLAPNGMISLPASIRDFPVYALRLMATLREALLLAGVADPSNHVVAYRSTWGVRVLASKAPWTQERLETLRAFCAERSFDLSWYPGMDVVAARAGIYNDLPTVSLNSGTVSVVSSADAIADEARAILTGTDSPSRQGFNLAPITLDRPFWYALPRLDQIGSIIARIELLPQAEVGVVVNVVVLAQASLIAIIVLMLPVLARARLRAPGAGLVRAVLYFPSLGLGFLFIEICLIDKASLWLNDRTMGFAIVLTAMLLLSGIGSMLADRFRARPERAVAVAGIVVLASVALMLLWLDTLITATLGRGEWERVGLLLIIIAPMSIALGMFFPLGLNGAGDTGYLPWAWALNGAFSVTATPLANLIARDCGYRCVLIGALTLYIVAIIAFPSIRKIPSWKVPSPPSPAGA